MKRKFFTLLAVSLAIGTSVYAQCPNETETAVAKIENGEYYHLRYTTARSASADLNVDNYFVVTKGVSGDSIIAATSAATDSAIWQVVKLDDKYYSFQNKATGNVLKLKAGKATASKFGWNFETAGKPEKLSFINDFKNYQVQINDAPSTVDTVYMAETAAAGLNIYPTLPGWKKLTLGELNAMYSDFFKLYDLSATSETDQAQASHKAIESKFYATDRASDDKTATTYYLNVLGTNKYLNVDTMYYNRIGLIDSIKKLGGHTLTLDTISIKKETSAYQFTIWKNVKDSIAIQVYGIPAIAASGETFAQQVGTAATTNGWITLSSYDAGYTKTALTAAVGCFNQNMPNPSFTMTKGLGKQIEAGYYFMYKGLTTDTMRVAILDHSMEDESFEWIPSREGKEFVAAAQWYVPETSYYPLVYNRESTVAPQIQNTKFYEVIDKDGKVVANTYEVVSALGTDTIMLVPFASEDQYLGYKRFAKTQSEQNIMDVYFQFNTVLLGGNKYAYISTGDTMLTVAPIEMESGRKYKIQAVDTFSIGNDVLRAISYKFYYVEGGKKYWLSNRDEDQLRNTLIAEEAGEFLVRATYEKDKYQILSVCYTNQDSGEAVVYDAEDRIDLTTGECLLGKAIGGYRDVHTQVSVASTTAQVYHNDELNDFTGLWSFVDALAPEYLTLEAGHYRIYSSKNSSLAITVNPKDSSAILKAEADVPGYENEWFSMYVSPYETDTVRPTYLIGTTQQGMISDADRTAGHVSYMINKGEFKAPVNTETTGNDSISFVNGLLNTGRDSISFYAADTLQSENALAKTKAVYFAFRKVVDGQDNEAYVESVNAANEVGYLAQSNGVLYFNKGVLGVSPLDNALKFVFGEPNKDVVTGNDEVSADAVKVVAAQGQVTIAGAAGKKVTISNILGQAVTKTVLSSDNAVIAAPAGVVVVAVEGEEAVKAIVK